MSAIASASQNDSPMLVLGGRAPAFRWGQGSLQEIDHVPFVEPLTRFAATAGGDRPRSPACWTSRCARRVTPHSGPAFVDFPLDHVFGVAEAPPLPEPLPQPWRGPGADERQLERAAALLRDAERPVIMAGTGLYWGRGEEAAAGARRGAADPGVPQRPRPRLPARRPRAGLLPRAQRRR